MKSSIIATGLLVLVGVSSTGCAGGQSPSAPAGPAVSATSAAAPSLSANPSTNPSATPEAPSLKAKDLKGMTLTAKELGPGWKVYYESEGSPPVSTPNCPQAQPAAATVEATARYNRTVVSKTGSALIVLAGLRSTDTSAWKAAVVGDRKACASKTYRISGTKFVIKDTAEGPTTVAGADEVIATTARRWYVNDKKAPVYTFRTVFVRKGQVVVQVTDNQSGKGTKGFRPVQSLLAKQLTKIKD